MQELREFEDFLYDIDRNIRDMQINDVSIRQRFIKRLRVFNSTIILSECLNPERELCKKYNQIFDPKQNPIKCMISLLENYSPPHSEIELSEELENILSCVSRRLNMSS